MRITYRRWVDYTYVITDDADVTRLRVEEYDYHDIVDPDSGVEE